MAKPINRLNVEAFTVQPRPEETIRTFAPKVGGSVTPSTPTNEAAPNTPPPPAKDD